VEIPTCIHYDVLDARAEISLEYFNVFYHFKQVCHLRIDVVVVIGLVVECSSGYLTYSRCFDKLEVVVTIASKRIFIFNILIDLLFNLLVDFIVPLQILDKELELLNNCFGL
jgi:hypothetical protein